ncbi:hypothetical protein AACH06_05220 [Ideonella sp. DXS29W]|uniref:Uncharacterized protein n=1 Tax=Ideonella lacteola TaxID=2984193 RepID=A0ABU9BJS1_9BURK
MNLRTPLLATLVATAGLAAGPAVAADTTGWTKTVPIVDTPGPGGIFGVNGFDVFADQSVAARFTVPANGDMRLARIGLWLMNNSETLQKKVRLTLETDALDEGGSASMPSGVELERWTAPVATLGWNPVEQFFETKKGPHLVAGRSYWVVAASMSPMFVDPVWTFAKRGSMITTTTFNGGWQPAGTEGSALTLRVDAHPVKTTP